MTHPYELLPDFCAGLLDEVAAVEIAGHVSGCDSCAAELASWRAVAAAAQHRVAEVSAPPPGPALARILAGTGAGDVRAPDADMPAAARTPEAVPVALPRYDWSGPPRPWRRLISVLIHQRRLVPRLTWLVSALVLVLGAVVAGTGSDQIARDVLAAVVPLVATIAVAITCGAGADPAGELATSTGVPWQVILLARLSIVLGWIFALAAVISVVLAISGTHGGPIVLMAGWTGPAAVLAAASFALSVRWRSEAGIWLAALVWTVRALGAGDVLHPAVGRIAESLWSAPTGALYAVGALLVALALTVPAGDPWRPAHR